MNFDPSVLGLSLNSAALKALDIAARVGLVCAGGNIVGGRLYRVNARTLDALARRGLVTLCLGPDGGMAARLTDRGREVITPTCAFQEASRSAVDDDVLTKLTPCRRCAACAADVRLRTAAQ